MRTTSTEVKTRAVGKNLIIDVRGKVDLFSSPKMRSAILEAINDKGVSQVSINLSEVSYLDSSGVATLVEGLQRARARHCLFVLFGHQFISMGLLAEIQIRTYHESQKRPIYVTRETVEPPGSP